MQDTKENIERLSKMLRTSTSQEESSSHTQEEAHNFVENVLQTPPSQKEQQKDVEGEEEVMQDASIEKKIVEEEVQQAHREKDKEGEDAIKAIL